MPTQKPSSWPGAFRFVPLPVVIMILLCSITTLGLAVSYTSDISRAPLKFAHYNRQRPSVARVFFYSATMPVLSILHALADSLLYYLGLVSPLCSLVSSIVFASGWLAQWTLWMDCEITAIGAQNSNYACFQADLKPDPSSFYRPLGVSKAIVDARAGFGGIVLGLYLIILGCAAAAVHKNRMARKHGSKLENKGYESELSPVLR
ncbi:MAG: hypothetical protein M1817_004810 [Caeruleum heppii]|nr:MAG: hypothetical protein M1817_004810 [Caeruleum heppii]